MKWGIHQSYGHRKQNVARIVEIPTAKEYVNNY